MAPIDANGIAAALRHSQNDVNQLKQVISQIQGWMQGMANVPQWIEDIPGKRSPYFEVIEISFSANSTAKKEGTAAISTDGPFVCTGIALFFQKTDGSYSGIWGPATAFGAKIALTSQQHGFERLFDQPNCSSFTVEITAHGADRLWQSQGVASALYAPEAGGAYMLPASHLFGRNSTIRLAATPDVSMPYATKLQGVFLGYKIIQPTAVQP